MRIIAVCLILAGCAETPPAQPLTQEQQIRHAAALEAQAGGDYEVAYEKLHLFSCLSDAQSLPKPQQSDAIAQCRKDWPQKPDVTISSR